VSRSRSSSFSLTVRGLAFSVLSLGAVTSTQMLACGDVGDDSYVPPNVTALNQVDLNNEPFCVGTCRPDYGSQRINCSADDGLEFFPVDVLNGDGNGRDGGAVGATTATGFYAYNDGTADFMQAGILEYPRDAIVTNDPSSTGVTNYEPPTVPVNDRCGPDGQPGPTNAHHVRGGLFYEWGGGIGRRLTNFVTAPAAMPACLAAGAGPNDPEYCPDPDPRIESVADLPENPTLRTDFYGMVADLRGWEGISFWARQGPNNTGGIRVYVGDRQLDEDIAFLEANAGLTPMCQRVKECGCRNHRPCTPDTIQRATPRVELSCWDPAAGDTPPSQLQAESGLGTAFVNPYDICGDFLCDAINPAWTITDPLFATPAATPPGTAQCQLYKLTNDLEEYYCYDANNPASFPADQPKRCGDGWAKGVALSTDWKFFKIPFTELRQEGYGQEFSYLDLSAITLVRFTWTQGWVDVWLDDVRFYRHPGFAALNP
jgi:hypothetical protein